MATSVPTDIDQAVIDQLRSDRAPEATIALWTDIYRAFEEGGPEAVKAFLADRVKLSTRRADKQMKEMRSIATPAVKPKRKSRK